MCCALCVSVGGSASPSSVSAKWTWWDSDEVHRSDVASLDELLHLVSHRLGLEHPATVYVYPKGEDNDVREKVVDDQQLRRSVARGYTLFVWERVKGSPGRETREGLPLTVRTKLYTADVARRLSMGAFSTASSPNHGSPQRPTLPSCPPPGLPKPPSPPIAARVFSPSSSSASSSSPLLSPQSSSPSSPSSSSSSTEKANKEATRYRDDNKCVVTGHSHQPNTQVGTALHCCHILNSSARIRQFNRGFIDFMKVHHPEVVSRYCDFIRPLSPEDMRRLKQHSAGAV